jgi:hypothetical protein
MVLADLFFALKKEGLSFYSDLPALKRSRVPFSKRFIVPTIDSELHISFGEQ